MPSKIGNYFMFLKRLFSILLLCFCLCGVSSFSFGSIGELQNENKELLPKVDSLQHQIKNQSNNTDETLVKVAGLAVLTFVAAFSFLVFVFYRRRRELTIKQQQAELQHQLSEVEMKALRSQMNPHFIFNCMNSIYNFMQRNETQLAGEYLIKFSNLIRLILENSIHREVVLEDDLKALELYIQMEQLRMNHKFDYVIAVADDIDKENVLVPPMIIQPFVENSIWHGLNNKPTQGKLTISISHQNNFLHYSIEDDGIENHDNIIADELRTNKKASLGMSLTQERIDVMNKMKNTNAAFESSDIRDENHNYLGKRVKLQFAFETAL